MLIDLSEVLFLLGAVKDVTSSTFCDNPRNGI